MTRSLWIALILLVVVALLAVGFMKRHNEVVANEARAEQNNG